MKLRLATTFAIAIAAFTHAEIAHAECTDAGACASNQYCATSAGDAGVAVTDGGAGVCVQEPCVVSTDCPNGLLCDTATEPHACIPHPTPIPRDAGTDAGIDDGGSDAGEEIDATLPESTPDASEDAGEAGALESPDASADTGSLAGGACDCDLAASRDSGVAALGASFALGLLAFARRRPRPRQP